jgi:dihydroorotase
MAELVDVGVVAFTDDGSAVDSAEIMRRAFEYAMMFNLPIIQHCEDRPLTKGGIMNEGVVSTSLGMPAMPGIAEETILIRDILIAEYVNARYHVAHISTAGAVEFVRQAKRRALSTGNVGRITCETTPHHFSLTDEAVKSFETNTKVNPPLRTAKDVEAVKQGLRDGTVDVIATDHAPHSIEEKEVEYVNAPFGLVGLETAIGLAISELVDKSVLTISELVEKMSTNPRKILNLPSIKIEPGRRANLTLLDPSIEWIVDSNAFHSKSKNSPFHGWKLRGKSVGVINNGKLYLNNP